MTQERMTDLRRLGGDGSLFRTFRFRLIQIFCSHFPTFSPRNLSLPLRICLAIRWSGGLNPRPPGCLSRAAPQRFIRNEHTF